MGRGDEAFYEAEVERVVDGAGGVGAVGAVAAAGALDEADVLVDGGDDTSSFEGCEGPGLEL